MAEEKDKAEKAAEKAPKAAKPAQTPEQAAEAASKKAARASGKGGKGKDSGRGGSAKTELASEKVKRAEPARLRKVYESEVRAKVQTELGLKNVMQVPRITKITINMGLGEAITNPKILGYWGRGLDGNYRAEAGGHQVGQGHRRFQAQGRSEDRRHGDAPPRQYVRVPGSPNHFCTAAGARLQGRFAQGIRWTRQLHHGHSRGQHLSGNRNGQTGEAQRYEHHHHHHRAHRRTRSRTTAPPWNAV
jgi:hypothetical protein